MQVANYCTLKDRIKIITPKGISFIDDVPEDFQTDTCYAATHQYQMSDRHCDCGKQLVNYQRKYCSRICSQKYRAINQATTSQGIYKICPVCKEFKQFKTHGQMMCSRSCASTLKAQKRWENGGF